MNHKMHRNHKINKVHVFGEYLPDLVMIMVGITTYLVYVNYVLSVDNCCLKIYPCQVSACSFETFLYSTVFN